MKNNIRKMGALLLAGVMAFSFSACEMGGKNSSNIISSNVTNQSENNNTSISSTSNQSGLLNKNLLTADEIKTVFNLLQQQAVEIEGGIFAGDGYFKSDPNQTIPSEPDYELVIDEQYKSLTDIKNFIDNTYTNECAKRRFSFYETDEYIYYKNYNGQLYVNNSGAHGFSVDFHIDTITVIKNESGFIELNIDMKVGGEETYSLSTFILKWENEKWLLDTYFYEADQNSN